MDPKLELIKGGGGSVRVGATGTISSLITKELGVMKTESVSTYISSSRNSPLMPASLPSGSISDIRLQRRSMSNEASSSSSHGAMTITRQKVGKKGTPEIPMLFSEDIALVRTPCRAKSKKKRSNIVEVVDIKCERTKKKWSSPISSRIKKFSRLGFSKLSISIR